METICHIEIIRDGSEFVARVHLADGSSREYRNEVFEDTLTEMVLELQEELTD